MKCRLSAERWFAPLIVLWGAVSQRGWSIFKIIFDYSHCKKASFIIAISIKFKKHVIIAYNQLICHKIIIVTKWLCFIKVNGIFRERIVSFYKLTIS